MATGQDLIKRVLRGIGFISPNIDPTSSESNQALTSINDMLAAWNRENLMLFTENRTTHSNTAAAGDYTWGASGNITSPARPDVHERHSRLSGTGTSQLEIPLHVIRNWNEWRSYSLKSSEATVPSVVFLDESYPDANLYYRPIPTATLTAILYTKKRLSALTLAGSISLPDGYERAIRLNAMVELAPEFRKPEAVTQQLIDLAAEAKGWIKSRNMVPRPISCDEGVLGTIDAGGDYNINSDNFY